MHCKDEVHDVDVTSAWGLLAAPGASGFRGCPWPLTRSLGQDLLGMEHGCGPGGHPGLPHADPRL